MSKKNQKTKNTKLGAKTQKTTQTQSADKTQQMNPGAQLNRKTKKPS